MELTQKGSLTIKRLTTLEDVQATWPFFLEGLGKLNDLFHGTKTITPATFLRVITDTVNLGPERGYVVVGEVDGVPTAYGIVFDNSIAYNPPSVLVYACYSVTKTSDATLEMLEVLEEWARTNGYQEVQAFSPRFSGSGFALFEKRFGFRRRLVLFAKSL
jgi:hypothetical protein